MKHIVIRGAKRREEKRKEKKRKERKRFCGRMTVMKDDWLESHEADIDSLNVLIRNMRTLWPTLPCRKPTSNGIVVIQVLIGCAQPLYQ